MRKEKNNTKSNFFDIVNRSSICIYVCLFFYMQNRPNSFFIGLQLLFFQFLLRNWGTNLTEKLKNSLHIFSKYK